MTVRYVARWDSQASIPMIGTGVWDGVDEQWVARNLTDRVASLHAAVLSLRYDEAGERPE